MPVLMKIDIARLTPNDAKPSLRFTEATIRALPNVADANAILYPTLSPTSLAPISR